MRFIYKRPQMAAYFFTRMFIVSMEDIALVWTIVGGERGATGIREAVIGGEMWVQAS